jgi:hypothetical protein
MNEWKVIHALHIFIKCLFLVMQFILYCFRACKKGALFNLAISLSFFYLHLCDFKTEIALGEKR